MMIQSVSVVAPAYREASGIEALIRRWILFLSSRQDLETFEIVICNDGSPDQTGEVLEKLSLEFPGTVRPVHHCTNEGAATALATAIGRASCDWILILDADGQFMVENLDRFCDMHRKNPAMAYHGVRDTKKNHWFLRFGSSLSGRFCGWVHASTVADFNCACKLVFRPLLQSIQMEAKGLNYSTEITSKVLERGIAWVEVPILHQHRAFGKSSAKFFRDGVHRVLFIVYIAFRQFLFKHKILRRPTFSMIHPARENSTSNIAGRDQ